MASIHLTINGQEVSARAGQTILEAAREAGIEIPTLCHHPALKPIGACRVCLVEVSGQRTLQPACTFPAAAGQQVQTESPKVVEARKFVLELIFSERNHFCMYCEMSGDCELQNLAYRYGLDHMIYPTYTRAYPVDASPAHFLLDHNRCVLCRRCIRACAELVGNHTLDLLKRGASTQVHADLNLPLGDSSCVACGVCLDVCPTGALVDKRSAFMGRKAATVSVPSTCNRCSVGCAVRIVTRAGNVLRVEGDPDAPGLRHLLCARGRFEPLHDPRTRLRAPAVKRNGVRLDVTWDAALREAAARLRDTPAARIGALFASDATNEALCLARDLFAGRLGVARLGLADVAPPPRAPFPPGRFEDLDACDTVLVAGADPVRDHPVVSFLVKRAVDRGTRLLLLEDAPTGLTPFADQVWPSAQAAEAARALAHARAPAVVAGPGLPPDALRALEGLPSRVSFLPLLPGVNTWAALELGFTAPPPDVAGSAVLYVACGERGQDAGGSLKRLAPDTFLVLQAAYDSPLAARADVLLPSAIWSERSGTITNTLGEKRTCTRAVEPEGEARADWEILSLLSALVAGKPVSASQADGDSETPRVP